MELAESSSPDDDAPPVKSSKTGLVLSVILCLTGAAAGYFGVSTGLLPLHTPKVQSDATPDAHLAVPDVSFVEIPSIIVTLPPGAKNDHLRFTGQIEVPAEHRKEVEFLMPRIQDVLNGYLRALTADDIEGAGALFKIRMQLFRRIVMVVGLGKANGLLVTEFVLN